MTWKALAVTAVGVLLALLGVLWFLQGADVIHLQPVLCVANCEPVVGGSTAWMVAGIIAIILGTLLIGWGARRPRAA